VTGYLELCTNKERGLKNSDLALPEGSIPKRRGVGGDDDGDDGEVSVASTDLAGFAKWMRCQLKSGFEGLNVGRGCEKVGLIYTQ